ncbi:MAG: DnaJ domain-containing protein [Salinisphaera sp.]|jgi:curved DNA-binding protein|nr:DnaJ domain-containing protein [Salinisphaera sp.]
MEYKDYYKILGVARDASVDDVKRAYRKLARKYHPDVSAEDDAGDRFREANEAYEVLKDPEKRAAYDQIPPGGARTASPGQRPGFEPPPGWDAGFEFSGGGYTGGDSADFSDFFESLFGRGGVPGGRANQRASGAGASMRGQDHTARILLDIEDSFSGGSRTLNMRMPETDDHGRVVTRERAIKVSIPKGVRAGQQLRLAGQGMPGVGGGPAGDLYLEIGFNPHRHFRVDGQNLILDLPVAPWEAALGATVKTPTPAGPVDLKIPAGSNTGRRLRLKGRGMPGKTAGDLFVVLQVTLPPDANDAASALYQQMADTMSFNPRQNLGV